MKTLFDGFEDCFPVRYFFKKWQQLSCSSESFADNLLVVHQGPHNRFISLLLQSGLQQDMSLRHVRGSPVQAAKVHTHHYNKFMDHMWNGRFSGSLPAWVTDLRFRVKLWAIRSNLFRWCRALVQIYKQKKDKKRRGSRQQQIFAPSGRMLVLT